MTELTTATALDILEDGDLIAVRKAGATGVKKGTASQLRDYILSNLKWKNPVRAKTTAALAANTYANGTSGVGATLTGNANGALAAQDGVTLVANDRLLVADEGTGSHNGIYTVTQVGDGSHPYILTRAADADQASELVSAAVKVSEGSTQADNEYSCTTDGPLTIGTTALVWSVLSSGGSLASTTEQLTGTDASKRSTPDSVAALWEKGADIASSGTLTVGEGGYFHITGTTAITALALSVDKAGRKVWLKFDGSLTLTHNATSLILPTGANIATAAGDIAGFVSEGSGNFRCFVYQRADGTALASSGGGGSALTVKDEGTNLDTAVTSIDFVGAGVTATNSGHAVTVTISGGGSSDMVLLQTVTVSSPVASVALTAFDNSTYRSYKIIVENIGSSASDFVRAQLSTNGGSTWDTASNYVTACQYFGTDGTSANDHKAATTSFKISPMGTTNDSYEFEMSLNGIAGAKKKLMHVESVIISSGDLVYTARSALGWKSTSSPNAIKFFQESASNFTAGVFKLFGLK